MISDTIKIIDCGGSQAFYTARKLRLEGFYCEMHDMGTPANEILTEGTKGLILIGDDTGSADCAPLGSDYTKLGVPVLALGEASRALAVMLGGKTEGTVLKEKAAFVQYGNYSLLDDMRETDHYFHRIDHLTMPEGWKVMAATPEEDPIIFGCPEENIYAFQGYIEANDPEGFQLLNNFSEIICKCKKMESVPAQVSMIIDDLKEKCGRSGVLLPVFMSTESAVAAKLLDRAVGNRLTCLFIQTGLYRDSDQQLIERTYREEMGLNLSVYDASERFMKALKDVSDPAEKRAVIHKEYELIMTEQYLKFTDIDRFATGTTYNDILKHRDRLFNFELEGQKALEPLKREFREDVHMFAEYLGVPEAIMALPPFSVAGLAVRCLGKVTPERLALLKKAENILQQEIEQTGYAKKIAQSFVIITDLLTHGEHGMGYVCVLRALGSSTAGHASAYRLPYDLMENVVARVTDEVRGISRVVYDITGRPTADLEWE